MHIPACRATPRAEPGTLIHLLSTSTAKQYLIHSIHSQVQMHTNRGQQLQRCPPPFGQAVDHPADAADQWRRPLLHFHRVSSTFLAHFKNS